MLDKYYYQWRKCICDFVCETTDAYALTVYDSKNFSFNVETDEITYSEEDGIIFSGESEEKARNHEGKDKETDWEWC